MKYSINIKNLYKEYKIGTVGSGTLYRDLQSLTAKIFGKEDPNSLLGTHTNKKINTSSFFALKNININILENSVTGIIGRNGAGKSTLLKILSRITAPSSGSADIYGRTASLLEVGTGFHPELTGSENIYLNASINGMTIKEISKKFDNIVDFAGIEKLLHTPVKRYSSGMLVRLGFAVAVHLESNILIIDEVLAVGDIYFRKKAEKKLKEIITRGNKTILYVSHNLDSVRSLCDKVALLENGNLIEYSETDVALDRYLNQTNELLYKKKFENNIDQNKNFQVLKIYIENNENQIDFELDRTKDFTINIIYKVKNKIINNFVGFNIHTNTNHNSIHPDTPVLQWSERHHYKYLNKKEEIIKESGLYHAQIKIPGYILTQGDYYLNFYIKNLYNFVEKPKDKFFFRLYDINSSHNFNEGISAGLIAMPLNWEEKILSE